MVAWAEQEAPVASLPGSRRQEGKYGNQEELNRRKVGVIDCSNKLLSKKIIKSYLCNRLRKPVGM
jgi:hypothetical protein